MIKVASVHPGLRIDGKVSVPRLRVKSLRHGHSYYVGKPWQSWKEWIEDGGWLLRKEGGTS